MTTIKIETEKLKYANGSDEDKDDTNGGMLALAEAVLGGSEEAHLSDRKSVV